MNAHPSHKTIAFFMLSKRPSPMLLPISPTALQARLGFLKEAHRRFDTVTAQEDVNAFYQCLAHSLTMDAGWRERWIKLEIQYLVTKVQCYYAHLEAICKAEGVYLKRKAQLWDVKFPWETREYPVQLDTKEIQALAERALDPLRCEGAARWYLEQVTTH